MGANVSKCCSAGVLARRSEEAEARIGVHAVAVSRRIRVDVETRRRVDAHVGRSAGTTKQARACGIRVEACGGVKECIGRAERRWGE